MNKKETILKYFCELDIDGLGMVLDDSRTFFGVRKDVFLKKLGGVFEKFREAGDTELLIYEGECGLKSCNFGSKGYCFMGNHSGRYINLIFFGSEDDVTDIYKCTEFITDAPGVMSMGGLSLSIGIDEKADFVPSKWYLNTLEVCNKAMEEFSIYDSTKSTKEDYLPWLKKYEEMYEELSIPFDYYQGFKKFILAYDKLKYKKE